MCILNHTFCSLITTYLRSSYRSSGHPEWRQRPPGLPAPSLLQVAEMKIGETQPPTGATSPAAHNVRRHHLAECSVCAGRDGMQGKGGVGGDKLIQNVCCQVNQAFLNETDLNWSTEGGSKRGPGHDGLHIWVLWNASPHTFVSALWVRTW